MYLLDYEEKVQNLKSPDKKTMKNTEKHLKWHLVKFRLLPVETIR